MKSWRKHDLHFECVDHQQIASSVLSYFIHEFDLKLFGVVYGPEKLAKAIFIYMKTIFDNYLISKITIYKS